MTVAELIERLRSYPSGSVINGVEDFDGQLEVETGWGLSLPLVQPEPIPTPPDPQRDAIERRIREATEGMSFADERAYRWDHDPYFYPRHIHEFLAKEDWLALGWIEEDS